MTNGSGTNAFNEFVSNIGGARGLEKLANERGNEENPSDISEAARKKFLDEGYAYGIQEGRIDPNQVSRADLDDVNNPNYSNYQQQIQGEVAAKKRELNKSSSNYMSRNLDSFVDSEVPESALEKLLGNERSASVLLNFASDENKSVLRAYQAFQATKEFAERYERSGKPESEEEAKVIADAAVKGAKREGIKRAKDKGYDTDGQAMAAELSERAVGLGFYAESKIKDYAVNELKSRVDKVKEAYEKVSNDTGKDGLKATKDAYKELAKKEFVLAKNMLYGAATDKLDEELAKVGIR
jgi:hypothetical protein